MKISIQISVCVQLTGGVIDCSVEVASGRVAIAFTGLAFVAPKNSGLDLMGL